MGGGGDVEVESEHHIKCMRAPHTTSRGWSPAVQDRVNPARDLWGRGWEPVRREHRGPCVETGPDLL